jgi:hypothetical protein
MLVGEMITGRGKFYPNVPTCHLRSLTILELIVRLRGKINENKREIIGITAEVSNNVTRSGVRKTEKSVWFVKSAPKNCCGCHPEVRHCFDISVIG